ncbi:MAG: phage portal protein [Lachnospiraceae bacterium]|nr:phage portal protein [Lachnospiraceae bacterium]
MPRAPSGKQKEGEALFRKGMKLSEIAKELGVAEGTVRSWKNRHHWGCSVAGEKRSVAKEAKEEVAGEVEGVMQNTGLTDKQRLFCIHYIRCFNATKAYQKAYGCNYATSAQNGSRLLKNAKVKNEIMRMKRERLNREFLSEADIFQKYMDIAFADITDFTEFGKKRVKVDNPITGKEEEIAVSYVNIRDSQEVDGTLVSEVSKGRDGIKVKLADRMKALRWLSEHMDMATAEQEARIKKIRAETERMGKDAESDADYVVDDWVASVMGEAERDGKAGGSL